MNCYPKIIMMDDQGFGNEDRNGKIIVGVDRFSLLPESLLLFIIDFLCLTDKISSMTSSKDLYYQIFKRAAHIVLKGDDCYKFFVDSSFQQYIVDKIERPCDQLSLHDRSFTLHIRRFSFTQILAPLTTYSFYSLFISADLFTDFCERFPENIPSVRHLTLSMCHSSNYNWTRASRVLQYLFCAVDSVRLVGIEDLAGSIAFSDSLKSVCLENCTGSPTILPRPNLRSITLINSMISNLNYFNQLHSLDYSSSPEVSLENSREAWIGAKKLTLRHLNNRCDPSILQNQEEIHMVNCRGISDFTNCFQKAKVITLESSFLLPIDVDLSRYPSVEEFSVVSSLKSLYPSAHGLPQISLQHGLSTGSIPDSLKSLTLSGVTGFDRLPLFNHLKRISLVNCPNLVSLLGLRDVEFVHLNGLEMLRSLEGLGANQHVIVDSCHKIEDFTPLKFTCILEVKRCVRFRDASQIDRARFVKIEECPNIVDVSPLKDVECVELVNCRAVKYFGELEGQKKLIVRK